MTAADFAARLGAAVAERLGPPGEIRNLARLTGGATKTTWSFDAVVGDAVRPLILQQSVPPSARDETPLASLPHHYGEADARLMMLAAKFDVPVPTVVMTVGAADELDPGFVTERIDGETLGRRINTDDRFAAVRPQLAGQCGRILAAVHRMAPAEADFLIDHGPAEQLRAYREIFDYFEHPQPVIELGLSWAADNLPRETRTTVVHGDFRNGNLIVGEDGVRAVIDWEIASLGDPMSDLGWLCVKTWRFGGPEPVGGFGRREDLFEAYEEASGTAVDPAHVRFWEAFGCIKWSIMCMMKGQNHLKGGAWEMEQLAIGRRMEEPLYDFLNLIYPE